jgi:ATP-binding cassette subfamily B protein
MMHGGRNELFKQDALKARNLGGTLARLGRYFGQFWYMLVLAVILVVIATWTQVTTPELTGQATDCFLIPVGASSGFATFPGAAEQAQASQSSCWLASDPQTLTGTQRIIATAFRLGGYQVPNPATSTNDQRIEGLWRLILG